MQEPSPIEKLPESLHFRLQFGRLMGKRFDHSEIEALRPWLKADPNTEIRILSTIGAPEYKFYNQEFAMLSLLFEENPNSKVAHYLIRYMAFQSFGEDGMTTESAFSMMELHAPNDPLLYQMVVRTAWLPYMGFRDTPEGLHGKDLGMSSLWKVTLWGRTNPSVMPLLIACAAGNYEVDSSMIVALCSQLHTKLDVYDLGIVAEPVAKFLKVAGNSKDPHERAKRVAIAMTEDRNIVNQVFTGELSPQDIAMLREAGENCDSSHNAPAFRLIQEAGKAPDLLGWVKSNYASTSNPAEWRRQIVYRVDDPDFLIETLNDLLDEEASSDNTYLLLTGLKRLNELGWNLPPTEGMDMIRKVIDRCPGGDDRWQAWRILIDHYFASIPDFSDLLGELREPEEICYQKVLLVGSLSKLGFHQLELAEIVALWTNRFLGKPETSGRGYFSQWLGFIFQSGAANSFEILMQAADVPHDSYTRKGAMDHLTSGWRDNNEVKELLLRTAASPDLQINNYAALLIARDYALDPDAMRVLSSIEVTWSDSIARWLSDPKLTQWKRDSETRRLHLLHELDHGEDRFRRINAVHSLAYWFGEDGRTLADLEERLRGDIDEPVWPKFHGMADRIHEKQQYWADHRPVRAKCLRTICLRWPDDPRAHQLAQWAMEHPWLEIREEASRVLSRLYSQDPQTPERIAPHIGESHIIFGEYTALMMGRPEGLKTALAALEDFEELHDRDRHYLALDGPLYLIRYFGPRTDLIPALYGLSERTSNPKLKEGIAKVFSMYFKPLA